MKFFSQLILPAAALLLLTGCPKKEMMQEIIGKKWVLETLNGESAKPGMKGQPVYFEINDELRVAGFSGCNRFFGQIEADGDRIKVGKMGSTMMACPPEYDDKPFLDALQNADQAELVEGKVFLKSRGKTIATFLAEGGERMAGVELKDTRWVLRSLGGESVEKSDWEGSREIFIRFAAGEENRMSGHAGCNSLGGSYELNGQSLRFGPLISTKMACPDLKVENRLLAALQTVDGYRIEGKMLTLMKEGTAVAAFQAD